MKQPPHPSFRCLAMVKATGLVLEGEWRMTPTAALAFLIGHAAALGLKSIDLAPVPDDPPRPGAGGLNVNRKPRWSRP